MTDAKFTPDHSGVGRMLRSEEMQNAMRIVAEEIRVRAIAIAPVAQEKKDYHPGRYKASFHVDVHERGGATKDRAEAVVYNNSPEAFWVEFAHWGREPYRVLAMAAFGRIKR